MPRILLVEDSPTQAVAHSVLLEEAGFEVLEARTAEQAQQLLATHQVDLLLADLTLPGQSGIDLCRHVRNDPRTDSLPVVMLTGSGNVTNVLRSLAAGASAYAAKGRAPDQLLATIQQQLAPHSDGEVPIRQTVHFRGEDFELNVTPSRLLGVMVSAFEDLSTLNEQHEQLNQTLEDELRHRTAAEKALRNSEAVYHSLVENVPVSLFRKDREGRFIFGNKPFCAELGIAPEELIGKTDHDFYPAELARKYLANDRHVMETAAVFEDVEEHRTPEGRQMFVQVLKAAVLDDEQNVAGVQCVFWDVTDRELAQRQLLDSEARKQAIFESSLDCMIISDQEGRIVEFNRAAEHTFGCQRADLLGEPLDSLFVVSDRARENIDRYSSHREEGSMIGKRQETPLRRRDGSIFMAEIAMQPIQLGDSVQFATVLHDITRRKKWELELQLALDAAEAANQAKSDFLANMSHEIRTPMNAVIGMTELVIGSELTSDQRSHLEIVHHSAYSLLDIINDILDFSKIEAGKLTLDPQPFAVRERLGDTMKSLAVRAHQKQLELACHISPDVPDALVGDAGRLRQVIVNLVGNAIKFTETGEVVLDVSVIVEDGDDVVLSFSVRDTGIGIPKHQQLSIFNVFEQADTSTTRRFGGTGLGLAISSRLVDLMDGAIEIESEPGQGSTFRFSASFRRADPSSVPDVATVPQSVDGLPALIVDDNETNRQILEEMLTAWGLVPQCVSGAEAGFTRLVEMQRAGTPFQLLVTDVNMPDVDGFQFVENVRNDPTLQAIPILMLTSADRPGDIDRCRDLGIHWYMTKPVKQSELLSAIESAASVRPLASLVPSSIPVNTAPLRILLAEDSRTNQMLAIALLEQKGHSIVVAPNGVLAVEKSEAESFDLIVMDVQMPEMDGLEATRRIRQREASTGSRTPIIAMTANAMKGDRERCLAAGMDDYVSKPIRTDELFAALARVKAKTRVPQVPALTVAEASDVPIAKPVKAASTGSDLLIDWTAARAAVNGDSVILDAVIEAVLEEGPALLIQLRQAIDESNAAVVHRSAHTIKGTMRTFNSKPVTKLAEQIESLGASGKLNGVADLYSQLTVVLNQALDEIRESLSEADDLSESIFDESDD